MAPPNRKGVQMETGKIVDRKFVLSIMDRLKFFSRLSLQEKEMLVQFHQNFAIYKAGETPVKEGEGDASFFIILSGRVFVTKGKDQRKLAKLEPGEFFGEISFLTRKPRTATVTADEDTIVLKVDETMLEKLEASTREKIKDNITEKLIERLIYMNNVFESLSV